MNNHKINVLLITLGLLTLGMWSCRKEVNKQNLNLGDDDIFIQSYLNPNTDTIHVGVSIAKGSSTKGRKIDISAIQKATVTISSNGVTKAMHLSHWISSQNTQNDIAVFALDSSSMPIIAHHTYTVKVDGGTLFSASGTTTIPDNQFDFSSSVSDPFKGQFGNEESNVKINIADKKNNVNYYRVLLKEYFYEFTLHVGDFSDNQDQLDTIYTSHTIQAIDLEEYEVIVSDISEDLYKYYESLRKVEAASGNPFAEPASLYSNIQGGLGIIGSMNSKTKKLK